MITAQDKILHVASKLGLTSLQNMQGSTGAVYDVDTDRSGQLFTNASRHANPTVTNVTENQFEVNEALLVESLAFYIRDSSNEFIFNIQQVLGSNAVIVFDLIIGNKRVIKDTPVFASGTPYTFANTGSTNTVVGPGQVNAFVPRHQIFMEGAGILIPPQVQYNVQFSVFDIVTGAVLALGETSDIGCYLFGTKVLLNFNTTI
jgi:hypothetical protein